MKIIRDKMPFVLLFFTMVLTILKYFEVYSVYYKYLGDILGYSILTNVFMYSVYMNKKYCTSTKVAVLGLTALNVFNIIYTAFDIQGVVYDIFFIVIVSLILIIYKFKI